MVRALETIIFYSLFWGGDQGMPSEVRGQLPVGYRNTFASHCRTGFPAEALVFITLLVVAALQAYSTGEKTFRFSAGERKNLHQKIRNSFKTGAGKDMHDIISGHMYGSASGS
jgi:hypothetical protein